MKTFALMFILPAAIIIIPFKQAYNNDLKKYIKMQAIAHTKDWKHYENNDQGDSANS